MKWPKSKPTQPDMTTLLEPDQYGNYWVEKGEGKMSGVFLFSTRSATPGRYFVVGGERGCLWDGVRLRAFGTPEEALAALRELIA